MVVSIYNPFNIFKPRTLLDLLRIIRDASVFYRVPLVFSIGQRF